MSIATKVKEHLAKSRAEAAQTEEGGQKAGSAASEIEGLESDIKRLSKRRALFQALGDKPVTFPYRHYHPTYGELEMVPMRSALTGAELAAKLEPQIASLEREIVNRQKQIAAFLKD